MDSNAQWGFSIEGTSSSSTFRKNNYRSAPTLPYSGVFNATGVAFDFTRNWWGTTDSAAIKEMIGGAGRDFITYVPFRLGLVDTASGADTVAPRAPDTVAASALDTNRIRVTWSPVTANEEASSFPVNLAGYRIHRSQGAVAGAWDAVGTVDSTSLGYTDTGLAPSMTPYRYRVTAFDAWPVYRNESWYSDSIASVTILFDPAGPNVWFVNDTSTAGDLHTSAVGNDANDGLTPATPKRTIMAVMALVTPGDTVLIDAGLYTETVVISTNSITLIGKDSSATVIDPPGDTSTIGRNGIYATNLTGLAIKNLGVTGAYNGIHFDNVDMSTVYGNGATSCGPSGIYITNGSDSNTVSNNTAYSNGNYGILLTLNSTNNIVSNNKTYSNGFHGIYLGSSSNNTVSGNLTFSNSLFGIYLSSSSNNTVTGNTANSNSGLGIAMYWSSNNNTVINNTFRSNGNMGIQLGSSSYNTLTQNTVDPISQWGFYIAGASPYNTFEKNNYLGAPTLPDSGVFVRDEIETPLVFTWNYWGTTDSEAIRRLFSVGVTSILYTPFRLGLVDTAPGADTVAPRAPDTVAAIAIGPTGIRVSWAPVTANEEASPFAVNLAGYRIHRSPTSETSQWEVVGSVGAASLVYTDTAAWSPPYYYRVTAFDAWPVYPNESWYSDSIALALPFDTSGPNLWYLNDTSTAGDLHTSAVGNDANDGLTPATPKRTLAAVLPLLTAGDTVLIDAGTYYPADSVVIPVNGAALLGVDSASTVIRLASRATANGFSIYASGRSGLVLRDFQVTNGYIGINLAAGVTSSLIERVWTTAHGQTYGYGIVIMGANNTVRDCLATSVTGEGISMQGNYHVVTGNTASGNAYEGFSMAGPGTETNLFTGNRATGNGWHGFKFNNTHGNIVTENVASGNSRRGFHLQSARNNTFSGNLVSSNAWHGFFLEVGSDSNLFSHNVVSGNSQNGFHLSSSSNNSFSRNTADSNVLWAVYIEGTSAADTFRKNIVNGSPTRPDSCVFSAAAGVFDFTRNWWGTTDSTAIKAKIWGTRRDSIVFSPYRLGIVDTAPGADTVATRAPDTVVAVTLGETGIRVSWSPVTVNEEASSFPVNLAGYRIHRAATSDSSFWEVVGTVGSASLSLIDSALAPSMTPYRYRVTAFDAWPVYPNESWYSDSIASATIPFNPAGPNVWYLNDTSTAGDMLTSAAGDDANDGLTMGTPKRTFAAVLPLLTPGDTVLIDAGWYYPSETITISVNGVALLGKDSVATVIDFNDSSSASARAIFATSVTNVMLRDFRVINGLDGVRLKDADASMIQRVHADRNGRDGFRLENADNNTLAANRSSENAERGFLLDNGSAGNALTSNAAVKNGLEGFDLGAAENNAIASNRSFNNSGSGFRINGAATDNLFTQNMADSNAAWAFYLAAAPASNSFRKNVIIASPGKPDSGLFNGAATVFDFTRHWWGTTDSAAVKAKIGGPGLDSIMYTPFRLGLVDTAPGADTVAPRAPDTVAAVAISATRVRVTWSPVTANAESSAFAVNLAGYRVYRARTSETSQWEAVGTTGAATRQFNDGAVTPSTIYHYRVTAFDAWPVYPNESWYSDSIAVAATPSALPAAPGEIRIFAGTGDPAFYGDGGPANAAALNRPFIGPTVAANGDVFIGDVANNRVRKVDRATGIITTVAGNGTATFGGDGGPATAASLKNPSGIALAANGDFYIADVGNNRVRKVTAATGIITTIAGTGVSGFGGDSGPATAALLGAPNDVALSENENFLFIADRSYRRIRRVDLTTGIIITVAGTGATAYNGDSIAATTANLYNPLSVTSIGGTSFIISENAGHRIRKVDENGIITTVAGTGLPWGFSGDGGPATAAQIKSPIGVNFNHRDSSFLFADGANYRIRRVDSSGIITTVAGTGTNAGLNTPHGDGGQAINANIGNPGGVAFDRISDAFFISEQMTNVVRIVAGNETIPAPPAPPAYAGPIWYVNDASTVGDLFTTTVGSHSGDGSAGAPFLSIDSALAKVSTGETIRIDAGWYVPSETITIPASNVALIGADSTLTHIDFNDTATGSARAIFASGRAFLLLRDFHVTRALHGIWWKNVDTSVIERVLSDSHGGSAFLFETGSPAPRWNLVRANTASGSREGFTLLGASYNEFTSNVATANQENGFRLMSGADSNLLRWNRASGNAGRGFVIEGCARNVLLNNLSRTNLLDGISLKTTSNNSILLNEFVDNAGYQARLEEAQDTFRYNHLLALNSPPATVLYRAGAGIIDLTGNWWGTADSAVIAEKIHGPGAALVTILPYRLGPLDTQAGAVSAAIPPRAPDTVATHVVDLRIRLSWARVTMNEEGQAAAPAGYRIYRAVTEAASVWPLLTQTTSDVFEFIDPSSDFSVYFYRVTAFDPQTPFENESFYSDSVARILSAQLAPPDTTPPAAFTLLTPFEGMETNAVTITFSWSAAIDSSDVTYRLLVDTDMVAPFVVDTTVSGTSATMTVSENAFYLWRVIATDSMGNAATVNLASFTVDTAPPSAPGLVSPGDGIETTLTSVLFRWTTSAGSAVTYRLQIANDTAFTSIVRDSAGITETEVVLALPANAWYAWRVTASDRAGNATISDPRTFGIDTAPPSAPAPISPANGTSVLSGLVQLEWTVAGDSSLSNATLALTPPTVRYLFEVARDSAFGTILDSGLTSATTQLVSLNLDETGVFHWRVRAFDNVGNTSLWGGPETFTRPPPADTVAPSPFALLDPVDRLLSPNPTLTFSWTASHDSASLVSYWLQIANDTGFTSLALDTFGFTETSVTLTVPPNAWYAWRITASDSSGNSTTAGPRILGIDTAPPAVPNRIGPINGRAETSPQVTLLWSASIDPALVNSGLATESPTVRYRFEISRESAFIVILDSGATANTSRLVNLPPNDTGIFHWRVSASDSLGNTSPWGGPETFSRPPPADTVPPSPFVLLAPSDRILSPNPTFTFSWTASHDSGSPVSYWLQLANDTAFTSLALDTFGIIETSVTLTIPPNAWYAWRVTASDSSGNSTTAGPRILGIDTAPPAVPNRLGPINGRAETSAQIRLLWGAAIDPALVNAGLAGGAPTVRYHVELSRNAGFSTLVDSALTSETFRLTLLTSAETGVLFWRVRSTDGIGNLSDWGGPETFTRPAPRDTAPPLPPFNLVARALDTGAVLLTWDRSPSTDVSGYPVYWNAGADTLPTLPLGYFVSDSRASFTWRTDSLTPGLYGFRVQTVDRDGFMDRNASVVNARVNAASETNLLLSDIITPQAGKIVNRTGGIEVVARIVGTPTPPVIITRALFQYRVSGGVWMPMTVAANRSNPVAWNGNGAVSVCWEAAALSPGAVEIRAVPMAGSIGFETGAARIMITLNDNKKDADISNERSAPADSAAVSYVVNTYRTDTVITSTPSGGQITVVVPTGVAPAAPDTEQVRLEVLIAASSPVETSTLSRSATPVGFTASVSFSNKGQPGGIVEILLPLPDLDGSNTILLNGRRVPAVSLQAWTRSSDTGRWERLDSCVIDLVNRVARLQTRHFSFFTLAAPVVAAANLAAFTVYPNPFQPNDGNALTGVEYNGAVNTGITFENLPQGSRIRIFTALGEQVADHTIDATGGTQWDVRNARGERVASGVYVYIVTAPNGERRTGKLAVVR